MKPNHSLYCPFNSHSTDGSVLYWLGAFFYSCCRRPSSSQGDSWARGRGALPASSSIILLLCQRNTISVMIPPQRKLPLKSNKLTRVLKCLWILSISFCSCPTQQQFELTMYCDNWTCSNPICFWPEDDFIQKFSEVWCWLLWKGHFSCYFGKCWVLRPALGLSSVGASALLQVQPKLHKHAPYLVKGKSKNIAFFSFHCADRKEKKDQKYSGINQKPHKYFPISNSDRSICNRLLWVLLVHDHDHPIASAPASHGVRQEAAFLVGGTKDCTAMAQQILVQSTAHSTIITSNLMAAEDSVTLNDLNQ